jgi:hypothetical protein
MSSVLSSATWDFATRKAAHAMEPCDKISYTVELLLFEGQDSHLFNLSLSNYFAMDSNC